MAPPSLKNFQISIPAEFEQDIKNAIVYIKAVITQPHPKKIHELIHMLIQFNYDSLLVISQQDESILNFFRSNAEFAKQLITKIPAGHPTLAILSMDGKENYSVFDFYLAACFMTVFYQSRFANLSISTHGFSKAQALEYATSLGLCDALIARCLSNDTLLKDASHPESKREQAIQDILRDVDRLSNIYWAYGYSQGAIRLLMLGISFTKTNPIRSKEFLQLAVKNFLCAKILDDLAAQKNSKKAYFYSQQILDNMTQGKGLLFSFEKVASKSAPWEEIQDMLLAWIAGDSTDQEKQELYQKLLSDAEREITHRVKVHSPL